MKFLHLADLHLGKRVNGFDMLEDQRFILEQILTLCEKHGVEAVVMTEKDAVKLRGLDNGKLWVLPVAATLMPDLADWLTSTLKKSVYGQQTA